MLEVNGIYKLYESKKIGEFTFETLPNETIAILGKSGAGKSTLIKMVTNNITPSGGKVLFNGDKLSKSDFTYISQIGTLFNHLTIEDNLELTNDIKIQDFSEYFKLVNLDNTYLEKYPFELSGGERQRIDLMRAIMCKSKLLILDEVFSALDFQNKWNIYDVLEKVKSEYQPIILLITHDLDEAIHLGDKIMVLDEGKDVFLGTTEEFLNLEQRTIGMLVNEEYMRKLRSVYLNE